MGRRLAGYVPVHDGDQTTWYGPDDDIPADVAKKIGDHAWIDDDQDDQAEAGDDSGQPDGGGPTPPPLGGAGSGADAWIGYARELGVDVDDDAKRDDVVDAIREAGHPVE
jgi:hypothetical protein